MEWGEWWAWLGWFLSALFVLFIYWLIVIKSLTSRREMSEEDEYNLTGVVEFGQDTKSDNSDDDTNGLRSKFNGESG